MMAWKYADIAIAVVGFFIQCGLALLGLTLSHWKYIVLFAALVLFGALITGIAVYRGMLSAAAEQTQLNRIDNSTSQFLNYTKNLSLTSPVASSALPSIPKQKAFVGFDHMELASVDNQVTFGLNVYDRNTSAVPALDEHAIVRAIAIPLKNDTDNVIYGQPSKESIEQSWKDFEKTLKCCMSKDRHTLGPGESEWSSAMFDESGSQLKNDLLSGTKTALMLSTIVYSDDAGRHEMDLCKWVQPPATFKDPIVHTCGVHDGLKY